MIVKNEAHVLARCLASVRPLITHWAVVDTGSTDGTQEVVRSALSDLPGALHERPWRDFGTNRTEALELAKAYTKYALVIDADDTLELEERRRLPELTADAYTLLVRDGATSYWRTHIVNTRLDYRYVGVLHEVLTSAVPRREERLSGIVYRRNLEGARSRDPETYRKDAIVLEKALEKEPTNARYMFYLGQSWRDAGELARARDAYRTRAGMGGWDEETWYAKLEVAQLTARLGDSHAEVLAAYLDAYETRPSRAESLCGLARYLREAERIVAAYPFARVAAETPRPLDRLFLDESVYAWRAQDEFAVAAYWIGHYDAAQIANEKLLASATLPEEQRPRIVKNLELCRVKLRGEKGAR
jgi:glycosyltransferase involved in cell wall biosynthesis